MRLHHLTLALLLSAGLAHAQTVSPLGGSTRTPAAPAAPAPATRPSATRPPATTPSATTPSATTPSATTPSATTPTAAAPHRTRRTFAERFAAANTTNDGKLTVEQARAGRLVAVARDFDQIDTAKRGYVTLDEIKAFQTKQRAARRAARAAAKPQ